MPLTTSWSSKKRTASAGTMALRMSEVMDQSLVWWAPWRTTTRLDCELKDEGVALRAVWTMVSTSLAERGVSLVRG
ncbi:hypothetical protein HYQ46_007395 [Verticillium longisporum]|nr:hypothetical protein HYQ46_007395 [Verticillium longisporum]